MSDPAPVRRSTGSFVPHQATPLQRLAGGLIGGAIRACGLTQRWTLVDPAGSLERFRAAPGIIAIWHNRLAFSLVGYQRLIRRPLPQRQLAALVSASRDGALLAAILKSFDVVPVRGSTSRRGAQALLELAAAAERGLDLAITPDGPRGPCYRVQQGAVAIARLTRRPILPASIELGRRWTLKSWDRFQVPLPLGCAEIRLGPMLEVQPGSEEDLERDRLELEQRLLALTAERDTRRLRQPL